ncbi:RNA-guided endonuclease TnpB family protein [Lysinibacillus sp. LZ02]|uniref:RNA-guided endonuclease TnpB family protein n=1 Tax=Lysinibacillus sp. LZ02 TaxID=3420668 RepID=UPI003D365C57
MSTPSYVLTLRLKTESFQDDILDKRFEISRKIYNACVNELYKRYRTMQQSKSYQKAKKMKKGKERNAIFSKLNAQFGLTEYSIHAFLTPMSQRFKQNIDSQAGQKMGTRAFQAFKKMMFGEAKKVYFKRYGEMESVEGKSNKTGIRFINDMLTWKGLSIPVIVRKQDAYAHLALQAKVKYVRIKRVFLKGKYVYYAQLILEGVPPQSYNSEGVKQQVGIGRVGIDIGTSTVAASSEKQVMLKGLAPNVVNYEKAIQRIQRKMDRSKRATNPLKYNDDGTINRSNGERWVYSNRYVELRNQYRELHRKNRMVRKQDHETLSNQLLSMGDTIFVETMPFKGLQKRSKKTEKNKKGRFKKKKRFGRTLSNRAPSMLLSCLERKLKYNGLKLNKVNTTKVKASQYNHFDDTYTKKSLSKRWNDFDGIKVQRDLYSAFLLMNMVNDKDLDKIDRDLCFKTFHLFLKNHDALISKLKKESHTLKSMGIR